MTIKPTIAANMSNAEKRNAIQTLEGELAAEKRVTAHQAKQLEIITEEMKAIQESLENQDKLSNLRGWAVDRAISMLRIGDKEPATFGAVKDLAEQLASYTYGKDYTDMKGSVQ